MTNQILDPHPMWCLLFVVDLFYRTVHRSFSKVDVVNYPCEGGGYNLVSTTHLWIPKPMKFMKMFFSPKNMGYTITPKMKVKWVFRATTIYLPSSPTTQKHFNLTGLLKHDCVTSTGCMMLKIP